MLFAHRPPGRGGGRAGNPADRGRCTTAILPPASSPMRRRACSRLDDVDPPRFDSFASACDALRTLGHQDGVIGRATPAGFGSSRIPPHLRPLPSAGITRLPRYYGPLRRPAGPACPSRGSGWRVPRHRQGFPCCHHPPLPCVPPPLPRRSQPVRVARFPAGGSLPRYSGGSASAMPVSRPARRSLRVAAHMVAKPPKAARSIEVLQPKSLPPPAAPIATGWSDSCRAGFAPAEGQRLSTAHRISRASAAPGLCRAR